jgi:4-aminobutyrate aminotransferase-like enzyme
MEKYFGKYTEEDLIQGRKALAGGSVGKGSSLLITDQKGATFTDQEGKQYIDCTSQAWSLNIGEGRQEIIDVVTEQIQHTTHVRSSYGTVPKFLLSKRLTDLAPGNLKKVSYCLHGSVANEGAMKIAMRNKPNRLYFLTPWRGFAGRTLATIAMTWPHPNNQFLPFMGHTVRFPNAYCYRCPFDNHYPACNFECAKFLRKTIENSVDGKPIAILMEPMEAAGGMIDYPAGYLKEIRKICDDLDIMLIFDEIQTALAVWGACSFRSSTMSFRTSSPSARPSVEVSRWPGH